jgi:hypothetical protein
VRRRGGKLAAPVEVVVLPAVGAVRRRSGRRGTSRRSRLDEEGLTVYASCFALVLRQEEREGRRKRTKRLSILPVLQPLELVHQVPLDLGNFGEDVGDLEALKLADDTGHFL